MVIRRLSRKLGNEFSVRGQLDGEGSGLVVIKPMADGKTYRGYEPLKGGKNASPSTLPGFSAGAL